MQSIFDRVRMSAWMAGAALIAGCSLPGGECDLDDCPRRTYEISAWKVGETPPLWTPIDTVDTGQLLLEVHWKSPGLPKRAAAAATDCLGCEDILENARLTLDQPLIAGTDTLPAFTDLLAAAALPKVGTGGGSSLLFHKGVRFRKGENRIAYSADFRLGAKKTGSLSLERTLHAGGASSW